jgi:hypothetical protein
VNEVIVKILGTIALTLFGLISGVVGGIIAAYIISSTSSNYPFTYFSAFVFGAVFEVYGICFAIQTFWLYK